MMGYRSARYQRGGTLAGSAARNRYEGYQYSLLAPPLGRPAPRRTDSAEPYTVRAVAPALRSLVARTGNRCPECAGPLVNGEGCVACPVCGFSRQGW